MNKFFHSTTQIRQHLQCSLYFHCRMAGRFLIPIQTLQPKHDKLLWKLLWVIRERERERRCESALHKLTEVNDWAWSTWLTVLMVCCCVVESTSFHFCIVAITRQTLTFNNLVASWGGKQTTQRKHFPLGLGVEKMRYDISARKKNTHKNIQ